MANLAAAPTSGPNSTLSSGQSSWMTDVTRLPANEAVTSSLNTCNSSFINFVSNATNHFEGLTRPLQNMLPWSPEQSIFQLIVTPVPFSITPQMNVKEKRVLTF